MNSLVSGANFLLKVRICERDNTCGIQRFNKDCLWRFPILLLFGCGDRVKP